MQQYMTISQCAKLLSVCEPVIRRAIKRGRIRAEKIGRVYRIPETNYLVEEKKESRASLRQQARPAIV